MNEKQLSGPAVCDGSGHRSAAGNNGTTGFFEGCLLVLRRGLRKVFVLPGPDAGESEGRTDRVRQDAGLVHDGAGKNRKNLERDLDIYFAYLDGIAAKSLAKKHGITQGRIYQILKEMNQQSGRII